LVEFPGLERVDQLKRYIKEDLDAGLDDYIKNHINQGKKLASEAGQSLSSSMVENFFDRKYFKAVLKIAERLDNPFVLGIFQRLIDMANAKIAVRALLLNQPVTWPLERWHNGGLTEVFYWQQAYQNSWDGIVARLSSLWPARSGQEGFWEQFRQNFDLSQLDRHLQNVFLNYLRAAKFIGYGPEVVAAYFFAKKNTVRNINLIMALKLNNVPIQNIKNYLTELY
jgi:V/A-type H+-transporting ATPase subunit C